MAGDVALIFMAATPACASTPIGFMSTTIEGRHLLPRGDSRGSSSLGCVPLINHNPPKEEKQQFASHKGQRYKTCLSAERCGAWPKNEFGVCNVQVRGYAKMMCQLLGW